MPDAATAGMREAAADSLIGVRLEQDGFWSENAGDEKEGLLGFMCWQKPARTQRDEQWRLGFALGWNTALEQIAKATGANFTSHSYYERLIPDEADEKASS